MSELEKLLTRIEDRSAHIGIIGLGYVGLPLLIRFTEAGYRVLGIDTDLEKVETLRAGSSYIEHIEPAAILDAFARGCLSVTTEVSEIHGVDALLICVPTPLDRHRNPDLQYVLDTMHAVKPHLRSGQLICLESTTYPGTTEDEIRPLLESEVLVVGQDIFLAYSPEREDPGNPNFRTQTIPKICGGVTPNCLKAAASLYGNIIDTVVSVSSPRAAEMTKLLENIHRAVNIGLVNEMKVVADKMGIDIYEVIDAAATKPFGFVPYYPGPGLGGHCIPIDPFYLSWKAKEYGLNTRFIELAGEVNRDMPQWVIAKITSALNKKRKALCGANILIIGVAYKKNVDDMRESPALEIMQELERGGAVLSYSDTHVLRIPKTRRYQFQISHSPLSKQLIQSQDCIVIITDHDDVDYQLIERHGEIIVDTRGVFRNITNEKIIRA